MLAEILTNNELKEDLATKCGYILSIFECRKKMSKQMNVKTKSHINEHERKDIVIKRLLSVRSLKKLYEGYKTKNSDKWTLMKNIIISAPEKFVKDYSQQTAFVLERNKAVVFAIDFTEHKESCPNDFFSFDEIKKSILEIFRHFLHLCSIVHVQKLDAICKDRLTLSFEKNVVVLHEWHTKDDVFFATSLKSVSSLYSAADEYQNLLKNQMLTLFEAKLG
ncbi:hypothetical protein RFI_39902 [Reticulomyxa filosa]|uniref:Uncharacterized protein n=1 Tax=Reticulomyxa filosa TaxID=46433 RepID=X6L7A3_RETFI|nr:hypothetical protein RFI_39902 [Reticulomyxa filosa]|eukprot:ETN97627.1 hypothetical protein RFI_39902 [Reticulomyxa filosa]